MEEAPLNSVESLELMLAIAKEEGIQVRSEWLSGVRGGLVRVGEQPGRVGRLRPDPRPPRPRAGRRFAVASPGG